MTRQQCRAALDFPRAEGHWPAPKRRRVPVGPGGAARFGAADLSGPSPKSISVKERAMKALTKTTQSANAATVEKKWVLIDADGLVVGRVATIIANILRGKHKPRFTPHADCGDNVIVLTAEKGQFTGKNMADNRYYKHTGNAGAPKETNPKKNQ